MTQEDVLRMAREATAMMLHSGEYALMGDDSIKYFAKLVAEHEREACAKVCDSFQERDVGMQPAECAGAIRARGEKA